MPYNGQILNYMGNVRGLGVGQKREFTQKLKLFRLHETCRCIFSQTLMRGDLEGCPSVFPIF